MRAETVSRSLKAMRADERTMSAMFETLARRAEPR
jgi:hypothetical protein